MAVKVIGIIAERLSQPVAVIQHRSYAIETEAIEMELFQPISAVRQQEMNYFILTVVKAQ